MLEYPQAKIKVDVVPQYRNMAEGLTKRTTCGTVCRRGHARRGLEPKHTIVRGGTDGSRSPSWAPTPNLSTGEHNLHSPLEWTCLEEMQIAVTVLVELAKCGARLDLNKSLAQLIDAACSGV